MIQERVQAAVEPQEEPWAAIELQEMWAVAQLPEAKVIGVAKPPPQEAELSQPQAGGLVQPPYNVPAQ